MQKIKILIKDVRGRLRHIIINRSSLKNYERIKKIGRRNLWKRVTKKPQFLVKRGRTELLEKRFVRFRFNMRRAELSEVTLSKLMIRMRKRYNIVRHRSRTLITQRIAVIIAGELKTFRTFTKRSTGRLNKRELFDAISTTTFEREAIATKFMFEELEERILKSIMNEDESPSSLEDQDGRKLKEFIVIFAEQ